VTKSRIFLFLCLAFIGGVFAESLFNLPLLFWLGILIFAIALAAIGWGNKKALAAGFCLMVLAGGAWRFADKNSQTNNLVRFNDKGQTVLTGVVAEEPDVRSANIRYKIEAPGGDILLVAKKYPPYRYGDKLEITGKLKTPQSSEDFDYQAYLAKDDIYSVIYYPEIKLVALNQGNWLQEKLLFVKDKFEKSIGLILPEPKAAFLAGLILGEKKGLPQDLMDSFSKTGTTHIIALSGYNITIIAVSLMNLFNFFMLRRSISFFAAVTIIILFVIMTGVSASAVRAAVMGILVLIA